MLPAREPAADIRATDRRETETPSVTTVRPRTARSGVRRLVSTARWLASRYFRTSHLPAATTSPSRRRLDAPEGARRLRAPRRPSRSRREPAPSSILRHGAALRLRRRRRARLGYHCLARPVASGAVFGPCFNLIEDEADCDLLSDVPVSRPAAPNTATLVFGPCSSILDGTSERSTPGRPAAGPDGQWPVTTSMVTGH